MLFSIKIHLRVENDDYHGSFVVPFKINYCFFSFFSVEAAVHCFAQVSVNLNSNETEKTHVLF